MLFKLCNAFMGMGFSMLGADGEDPGKDPLVQTAREIRNILQIVVNLILGLATLAVVIYAIVIVVQFFRADSAEAREEAKKRLLYALIGLVAAAVIIFAVNFVAGHILEWVNIEKKDYLG